MNLIVYLILRGNAMKLHKYEIGCRVHFFVPSLSVLYFPEESEYTEKDIFHGMIESKLSGERYMVLGDFTKEYYKVHEKDITDVDDINIFKLECKCRRCSVHFDRPFCNKCKRTGWIEI